MEKQPKKTPPRRERPPIYVWVTPEEKQGIEAMAQATGNSASAYLRKVGLGHEVRSVLDYERVSDLAKVNGDLGRLGGLLKLWLTNDKRLAGYSLDEQRRLVLATLAEIDQNQAKLSEIMKTVVFA